MGRNSGRLALVLALGAGLATGGAAAQETPLPPPPRVVVAPPPPPPATEPLSKPLVPSTSPGSWVTSDDYPPAAMRDEREGVTGFRLTTGPDGLPQRCEVIASSGSADLDTATCRLVMERARFHVRRDAKGVRVGGTYTNRIRWQIPDDYAERLANAGFVVDTARDGWPRSPQPDPAMLLLDSGDHYPAAALAARQEGDVWMRLDVDAAGKVVGCAVTGTSMVAELDRAACALMRSDGKFRPALDEAGKPVRGVVPARFGWILPRDPEEAPSVDTPKPIRKFPMNEPGSATMSVLVDAEGKAGNCTFSSSGASGGILPTRNPCDSIGGDLRYIPFADDQGRPVARRITLRSSVAIEPVEAPVNSAAR